MNKETMDRWCERGIMFLMLAILVFGPLATGAVRPQDFLIIQGLAIGVMVLWGVRLWISPKPQLLWPPLCWVIVAFVVYSIARYLTADIEYVARRELIQILVYAFLFFAVLNNLHRQETTKIVSYTMIFLGMAISCYAVYQFFTNSDKVWSFVTPYKGRGGGTYVCPNHLAGLLEMLIPLALAYTLVGRAKPLKKVLMGYAALVMLAGLGASVSRAGWVSCGLALAVLFGIVAMYRGRRLPALVLLVMLMAGGAVFVIKAKPLEKRFTQPGSGGLSELEVRRELWESAVRLWKENIWFGIGPGHYNERFPEYRPFRIQAMPDRTHNDYLNVLTDFGIVGGMIVAAGLSALFIGLTKTWRHVRRSENEFGAGLSSKFAFVLGASIGLLALAFHSLMDFNMHIPANAILAFTLAALLTSHLRFATERFWNTVRPWMKVLMTVSLTAGVFYLVQQETRSATEYVWLERASRKPTFSPAQAELLEKAFAAESKNSKTAYTIGEAYRMQSFEGASNYKELAEKAMHWFALGTKLNPYDGYNYLRYGMCLDWLDQHDEAATYFNRADELDPNGFYTAAWIGWHYVQTGDYAAARSWFQRSKVLKGEYNDIAYKYFEIAENKLQKRASGETSPLEQ